MEDTQIIDLYWERSSLAIDETQKKYGRLCYKVASNILDDPRDTEECVNDTFLKAWNAMPPLRPEHLSAYLCKLTRNQALKMYRHNTAIKRGGSEVPLALEELSGCIPDPNTPEQVADEKFLTQRLNHFLGTLPSQNRKIFLRRYWNFDSVKEIAGAYGISESKVKVTLFRIRKKLKTYLEKEGITL